MEIGPGMGALTKRLKEKGSFLIAYEVDKDLEKFMDDFCDKHNDLMDKLTEM